MDAIREKLVELFRAVAHENCFGNIHELSDYLISNGVTVQRPARPLEEWGEDNGDVLWWKFPIEEPPYAGSPLDAAWPGYHTHWTPIPMPPGKDGA